MVWGVRTGIRWAREMAARLCIGAWLSVKCQTCVMSVFGFGDSWVVEQAWRFYVTVSVSRFVGVLDVLGGADRCRVVRLNRDGRGSEAGEGEEGRLVVSEVVHECAQ